MRMLTMNQPMMPLNPVQAKALKMQWIQMRIQKSPKPMMLPTNQLEWRMQARKMKVRELMLG